MDFDNPDIVHAFSEGYNKGFKSGWEQAKKEDVDMLEAACKPKEPERADPGFEEL